MTWTKEHVGRSKGMMQSATKSFGSRVDPPIWRRAKRANYCALRALRAARLGPSARKERGLQDDKPLVVF